MARIVPTQSPPFSIDFLFISCFSLTPYLLPFTLLPEAQQGPNGMLMLPQVRSHEDDGARVGLGERGRVGGNERGEAE